MEEVDDWSNSDKVKSTVIGSESQMEISTILLTASSSMLYLYLLSPTISDSVFQRNPLMIHYLHIVTVTWSTG